ncbi:hypothetical protein BDN70DRAFT_937841 [Pholiota conissans]|uniref:Uncharacterized protein n=1 Tax=Pholiota conissans TaxID=109636 RepID=A0A9P5YN91_9AGAR|nr:hypothetical protein BDN70DRAFT_937841 [Pholiota conissans]
MESLNTLRDISSWNPEYLGSTPTIDPSISSHILAQLTSTTILKNLNPKLPWGLLNALTITASKEYSTSKSGAVWTIYTIEFMGRARMGGPRHKAYITLCENPVNSESYFGSIPTFHS